MSAARIRVRIQQLILEGVDAQIGDSLAADIHRELKVLTGQCGLVVAAVERHDASTVALQIRGVTTERLGKTLANLVYERLGG
jgi:hypothetical protein